MKNRRLQALLIGATIMAAISMTGCAGKKVEAPATEAQTSAMVNTEKQTEKATAKETAKETEDDAFSVNETVDAEAPDSEQTTEKTTEGESGEVTLGDYHNLTYTWSQDDVTDESVQDEINTILASATPSEYESEGVVAEGDYITLNYKVSIDGKEVKDMAVEDDTTIVGSADLTEDFDNQLVGLKVGEPTNIEVTFADDYWSSEVAGKTVVFTVTVTGRADAPVKRTLKPAEEGANGDEGTQYDYELTDDWVKANTKFANKDEYTKELRADLEAQAVERAQSAAIYQLVTQLVNISYAPVSQDEIKSSVDSMVALYKEEAEQNSLSYDEYLSTYLATDAQTFEDSLRSQAEEDVARGKILDAFIALEDLDVSEDAFEAYANTQADLYGYEDGASLISDMQTAGYEDYLRTIFKETVIGKKLMDYATRVEAEDMSEGTDESLAESVELETGDALEFVLETETEE